MTATRRLFNPAALQTIPVSPVITPKAETVFVPLVSPPAVLPTPSVQPSSPQPVLLSQAAPQAVSFLPPPDSASPTASNSSSPPALNRKKSSRFKGVTKEDETRFAQLLERDRGLSWSSAEEVYAKVHYSLLSLTFLVRRRLRF